MVETKSIGLRRMGQERWKYLDMANMSFAAGDYITTQGYINAFLETIPDSSETSKKIKNEFDSIDQNRRDLIKTLEEEVKDLGYLEQNDILQTGRRNIEIDSIYNMKTVCWTIAMQDSLFTRDDNG